MEIRFISSHFRIERADLWLYDPILGYFSGKDNLTADDAKCMEEAVNLATLTVLNGSVQSVIDQPGLLDGALWGIMIRRFSTGQTEWFAMSEFRHQVSGADCQAGLTTVNLDRHRELMIRVHDDEGHPVGCQIIGMVRFHREGGLDFTSDENGEVKLLLEPGMYGGGAPGGPNVRFEVTAGEGQQVVNFPGKSLPT